MSQEGGISPRRASRYVLPLLSDSSNPNSSLFFSISSPMRQRIFSRCEACILRHVPFSNELRAARTARSTSSGPASGTVVSCSPVAGFITGIVLPEAASSYFPLMKSFRGFRALVKVAVSMDNPYSGRSRKSASSWSHGFIEPLMQLIDDSALSLIPVLLPLPQGSRQASAFCACPWKGEAGATLPLRRQYPSPRSYWEA